MYRLYYFIRRSFRFRRFCHKAYAVFRSLHREVTIGRIAGYMTDLELLKAGRRAATCVALLAAAGGFIAADEGVPKDSVPDTDGQLRLREVLVVSPKAEVHSEAYRQLTLLTREDIAALPVQTVSDILQYLPGVDVRTRGANGVQADVSMRGGTYDQVLVLLNGVPLNDAQTGHYTLNLPVSPELIARVEMLQGTSAGLSGAFSGAVNIVTADAHSTKTAVLKMTAGMNGLLAPEAAVTVTAGETQVCMSAGYSRADGYDAPAPAPKESVALRNSDYRQANIYAQVLWRGLQVQTGAQWKDAGMGMGYGFGSQDQFDATRTAFASVRYGHRWGAWRLTAEACYRANHDRYEWHRRQEESANRHFLQTASAGVSAHYASRIGTTSFGISMRNDHIRSGNLGTHNRLQGHGYAEQTFNYAGLSASLGVNGMYATQFGWHMGGGANIGYAFARTSHVYVNANRSLRLPTFTDLYYDAGNQIGNSSLKPEEAWLLSVGYKGAWQFGSRREVHASAGALSVALDGYFRWGRNIIDWVYVADDTKRPFHAENQPQVNATGMEVTVCYRLNEWLRSLSADYAYTYQDIDLNARGSRYLDYLSHKLTLRLEHGIYKGFGASWTLRFQVREGQYNDVDGAVRDYTPVWLLDGSVFWENTRVRVSAECTNMSNSRYYDYGGVLQPGAWAKVSLRARLSR